MRLPFGLDLKTVIVTLVLVFVVWPFVSNMLASRKSSAE